MPQILEQAEKALEHDLCDHCLGRIFAHVDTGLSNHDRGRSIRMTLNFQRILDGKVKLEHQKCWVCEDIFDNVGRFADAAIEAIRQVVLQSIEGLPGADDLFKGGAIMGDGTVAMILDVDKLIGRR